MGSMRKWWAWAMVVILGGCQGWKQASEPPPKPRWYPPSVAALPSEPDSLPPAFHYRRLANGMEVVVFENPHTPILVVGWYVRVGHFLPDSMSMLKAFIVRDALFYATKEYPSHEVMMMKIQQLGLGVGYASEDNGWGLFLYCPSDNYAEGMAFAAELIRHPLLGREQIAKARLETERVVRTQWENDRARFIHEATRRLYPKNTPLQTPPLHWAVDEIADEAVRAFYRRYWTPDNALLVIGGRVKADQVFRDVERLWGDWRAPDTPVFERSPVPKFAPLTHNTTFVRHTPTDRALYLRVYQGPGLLEDPVGDETMQLLGELLNYSYGRFQRTLKEAGAERIRLQYQGARFSMPVRLEVTAPLERMGMLITIIVAEFEKMATDPHYFSDAEFEYAKRRRSSYYSRSISNFMNFWGRGVGRAWSIGNVCYFVDYERRIKAITREVFFRKLRRYLKEAAWVDGLLAPPGELPESLQALIRDVRGIHEYQWNLPVEAQGTVIPPRYASDIEQIAFLLSINPRAAIKVHVEGPMPDRVAEAVVAALQKQAKGADAHRIRPGRLTFRKGNAHRITFSFTPLSDQ